MNKRRENSFNVNEWEEETGHGDRPHTCICIYIYIYIYIYIHTHTHTHTHTKRCERNKGERRVEDKGIKVYKKFSLKWDRELTLMKGTCVPIHYMEAHRGNGLQLHSFLISSLDGHACSASRSGRFAPGDGFSLPKQWENRRTLDLLCRDSNPLSSNL